MADTYKETKVFEYPDMIVRVHIPDITPEKRAERMRGIHNAAELLVKEAAKKRRKQ